MNDVGRMAQSNQQGNRSKRSAKGRERRQFERHSVESVHGILLSSIDARIVNISLEGVAVETNDYLQVGREYSLRLNRGDETLPLQGKIAWCSLVRTTKDEAEEVLPVYRAGIHFEQVMSDTAKRIYEFLEENALIKLEKRLFGRFKPKSGEPADVLYEARFAVKKISQSGMRIQTDAVPEVESVVDLEMQLDGKLFRASGRVVHVQQLEKREGDERPRIEVGLEFLNLGAASRRIVKEFISRERI